MPSHHERRRRAARIARHTLALGEPGGEPRLGGVDAGIGQRRQARERLGEIGPAGEVTPSDAHHFARRSWRSAVLSAASSGAGLGRDGDAGAQLAVGKARSRSPLATSSRAAPWR